MSSSSLLPLSPPPPPSSLPWQCTRAKAGCARSAPSLATSSMSMRACAGVAKRAHRPCVRASAPACGLEGMVQGVCGCGVGDCDGMEAVGRPCKGTLCPLCLSSDACLSSNAISRCGSETTSRCGKCTCLAGSPSTSLPGCPSLSPPRGSGNCERVGVCAAPRGGVSAAVSTTPGLPDTTCTLLAACTEACRCCGSQSSCCRSVWCASR